MSEATTTLGTPLSPRWDAAWAAEVEHIESQLNRRICGAHSPNWTPCKLGPNHDNGRCRFHGGHPRIGAPKGNLNAVTHGLYMRRLQQCGTHCPLWQMCPLAGPDVLALEPKERPYCAYETEEYVQTLKTLSHANATREGESPDEPCLTSRGAAENAEDNNREDWRPRRPHDDDQPQRTQSAQRENTDQPQRTQGAQSAHSLSFRRKPESPCTATITDKHQDPDLTDPETVARSSSGATAPVDDTQPTATTHNSTSDDDPHPISFGGTFSFPKEKVPVAHNIALYQTMLSRATAAVRVTGLTDEYLSEGENFRASSTRVGAILNAQLRIARELRQWIRLAANDAVQGVFGLRRDDDEPEDDNEPKGLPDIMKDVLAQTEGVLEQSLRPGLRPGDGRPGAALP